MRAILLGVCAAVAGAAPETGADGAAVGPGIWKNGVGSGFRKGAREAGAAVAAGFGVRAVGGVRKHDLALATGHYGWVLTGVLAPDRWYRGNLELIGEVFAGGQFHPDEAYFVGVTPMLRYNFATGSRWVPFVEAGAGMSVTNIDGDGPDLSGNFQFNLQGGAGTHYFLGDDFAVTLGYRWLHFSNAGINSPNKGTNTQMFRIGVAWFF
ncbi:MAG: acyloxyacyl hydrolase [Pseudomonadota bacterium]